MPKGGLLHGHLDAIVDNSFLLQLGLAHPNIHISAPTTLTPLNIKSVLPTFKVLPPDQRSTEGTLSDPGYEPGTWVNAKHARDAFGDEFGGPEGFDSWVLGWMTINPNEAYRTHNSVLKVIVDPFNSYVCKR